jgi:two-component sensor histidine kinase
VGGQRNIQAQPVPAEDVAMLRAELAAVQAQLDAVTLELRSDRERESALRGELQRRARNVLAIIRSVFSRTVASGGAMEDVADHFRGRLEVLARYQQSRISRPTGTLDLEMMIRDELHDFQFGDDPRITIAGSPTALHHDQAQSLGLALHELVTNALKFGALAHAAGRLRIGWSVADGMLSLHWREAGVAVLAVAPLHYGFGREVIEQGLPYQLGATTAFTLRPGGLHCTIGFSPTADTADLAERMR